jgi:ankyrin repeat protein
MHALHATVSLRDKLGRTALMFSAELGHPDITQWLLEFKADAAAADTNGTTALMFAAKGGHTAAAQALLAAGAPLAAVNAKGSTALHFAAGGGSLQVCQLQHCVIATHRFFYLTSTPKQTVYLKYLLYSAVMCSVAN